MTLSAGGVARYTAGEAMSSRTANPLRDLAALAQSVNNWLRSRLEAGGEHQFSRRAQVSVDLPTDALTGKRDSAKMSLSPELLGQVRERFSDVEPAFRAAIGHGFDAPTESEARYLAAHRSPESVRGRILAQRDAAQHGLGAAGTEEGLGPFSRALPALASAGMAEDEMSRDEVTQMVTGEIIKTIATGNEIRRREIAGSVRAVIGLGDQGAILVRNSGSNSWLMSSWGCPPVQTCRPMTAA